MKLREIVEGNEYPNIEVRVYDPTGMDILMGFCSYTNGELKSLDGDSYSLDTKISEYGIINDTLVVVKHTFWVTPGETFVDTRNIKCVNAIDRLRKIRG